MSGDVNAEVRVYQPSLRYAFDSIFHQDIDGAMSRLCFDCRQTGIKIPFKLLVPFRHFWGWSPNLRIPVCIVRKCDFILPKLSRRLSVYHICHTTIIFENTEILSAKKPPLWMEGIEEVLANFGDVISSNADA